jgi:hypothetical protein
MDSWIGHFCCVFEGEGSTTVEVETSFATCLCKDLVEKKGIFVRWHVGNGSKIMFNMTKTYLQSYWIEKGVLTMETTNLFDEVI